MNDTTPLQAALAQARAAAMRGDSLRALMQARVVVLLAAAPDALADAAEAETLAVQHAFYLGRFDEALQHGERALAAWRRLDDPARECEVLVQMSNALAEEEVNGESRSLAEAALRVATERHVDALMPRALAHLGSVRTRFGEWEEAEAMQLHALSLARDRHDAAAQIAALNALLSLLGLVHKVHRQAGRNAEADAAVQRLLRMARTALVMVADEPQPFRRLVLRSNAAEAFMAAGRHAEALELLRGVVAEAHADGFRAPALRARTRLVQAHLGLGDLAGAADELARLQAELDRADHPHARSALIELGADLARAQGDVARAQALQAQAAQQRQARATRSEALRAALHRDPAFLAAIGQPSAA